MYDFRHRDLEIRDRTKGINLSFFYRHDENSKLKEILIRSHDTMYSSFSVLYNCVSIFIRRREIKLTTGIARDCYIFLQVGNIYCFCHWEIDETVLCKKSSWKSDNLKFVQQTFRGNGYN